ncbi:MAG: hypothetical protein ACREP9_15235 [Candidatus Dormibacteraceae bacterium]
MKQETQGDDIALVAHGHDLAVTPEARRATAQRIQSRRARRPRKVIPGKQRRTAFAQVMNFASLVSPAAT